MFLMQMLKMGLIGKKKSGAGAGVTYHEADTKTNETPTTSAIFTIEKPENVSEGDLIVLMVGSRQYAFTPPAGFTLIARYADNSSTSRAAVQALYKIATNSEPSTYEGTFASAVTDWCGVVCRITGHDPENPIDKHSGDFYAAGTVVVPSLNASVGNSLMFSLISRYGSGSSDAPSGMTLLHAGARNTFAYELLEDAGETGTRTWYSGRSCAAMMFNVK